MSRSTQPLRATALRAQSPALKAAQRGGSRLISPADIRRAAMKKRPTRKRYRGKAKKTTPLARILTMRKGLS